MAIMALFQDKHRKGMGLFASALSTIILFVASGLKHARFESSAWDLGIYDQAIYLISKGEQPWSSYLDMHILGDHASFIFYPLSLLYKIYPSVYWLLAVQALAFAAAVIPLRHLSFDWKLDSRQRLTVCISYLLYPLIFNVNLFDFHPEVVAIPALFMAILCARRNWLLGFLVACILVLSCKDALAVTVFGLGLWQFFVRERRLYGFLAIILGAVWLLFLSTWLVPRFGGDTARFLARYEYLGPTFKVAIVNVFMRPGILFSHLFTGANLRYLGMVFAPVAWGLSWRSSLPLIAATPVLVMNLLSLESANQKDLLYQYSIPILPFLYASVVICMGRGLGLVKFPKLAKLVPAWSLLFFLLLARPAHGFFSNHDIGNILSLHAAVNAIRPDCKVLADPFAAPHLSHRKDIALVQEGMNAAQALNYECIVLNLDRPGPGSGEDVQLSMKAALESDRSFTVSFQGKGVYLFSRLSSP
jgi:uncharacterized membrane protein